MSGALALPGPEAWGREAVGAECEACGGGPLRFDPASDSHRSGFDEGSSGWWYDGDLAHCEECGQPHRVRVDEYATLNLPGGEPTVVNARSLCSNADCTCGWPDVDHFRGEVTIALPFWQPREVVLWAGVVPTTLRRDGYALRAPCALLARRRGNRNGNPPPRSKE